MLWRRVKKLIIMNICASGRFCSIQSLVLLSDGGRGNFSLSYFDIIFYYDVGFNICKKFKMTVHSQINPISNIKRLYLFEKFWPRPFANGILSKNASIYLQMFTLYPFNRNNTCSIINDIYIIIILHVHVPEIYSLPVL